SGAQLHARDEERRSRFLLSLQLRSAGCGRHRRSEQGSARRSDAVRQEKRLLRRKKQKGQSALVDGGSEVQEKAQAKYFADRTENQARIEGFDPAAAGQSTVGLAGEREGLGFYFGSRMSDVKEEQKRLAAERAMTFVEENTVIGVGT